MNPPPAPPHTPSACLTCPQNRCVLMASYNGERCIRLWELPSFEVGGAAACLVRTRSPQASHVRPPLDAKPLTKYGLNRCAPPQARGTIGDVNNARAMAGSAAAQLVFSGDEHGRVKVWKWKAIGPGGFPLQ